MLKRANLLFQFRPHMIGRANALFHVVSPLIRTAPHSTVSQKKIMCSTGPKHAFYLENISSYLHRRRIFWLMCVPLSILYKCVLKTGQQYHTCTVQPSVDGTSSPRIYRRYVTRGFYIQVQLSETLLPSQQHNQNRLYNTRMLPLTVYI